MTLRETPSQTVGPYFSMRLAGPGQNVVASADPAAERIVVAGRVFDGERKYIEDALLEIWQANPSGRYNHPDDTRDLPLDKSFTGLPGWPPTIRPGPIGSKRSSRVECLILRVLSSSPCLVDSPGPGHAQPCIHQDLLLR